MIPCSCCDLSAVAVAPSQLSRQMVALKWSPNLWYLQISLRRHGRRNSTLQTREILREAQKCFLGVLEFQRSHCHADLIWSTEVTTVLKPTRGFSSSQCSAHKKILHYFTSRFLSLVLDRADHLECTRCSIKRRGGDRSSRRMSMGTTAVLSQIAWWW